MSSKTFKLFKCMSVRGIPRKFLFIYLVSKLLADFINFQLLTCSTWFACPLIPLYVLSGNCGSLCVSLSLSDCGIFLKILFWGSGGGPPMLTYKNDKFATVPAFLSGSG